MKCTCLGGFAFAFLFAVQSFAAPMNYLDFVGTDVTYLQVTEDALSIGDDTPLFGAPTITGNSLDFDPVSFTAAATGAGGVDITAGNVEFDIQAHANSFINTLTFTEAGNVTLAGFGTDNTFASVTATLIIDIEEVDGVPLGTPINLNDSLVFSPSGGDFGLATDGGGGPTVSDIWTGVANIDLDQALIDAGESFVGGATLVTVTLTNTLTALTENGTQASISKQDVDSALKISVNIPEPGTLSLLGLAGGVLGIIRRRR